MEACARADIAGDVDVPIEQGYTGGTGDVLYIHGAAECLKSARLFVHTENL